MITSFFRLMAAAAGRRQFVVTLCYIFWLAIETDGVTRTRHVNLLGNGKGVEKKLVTRWDTTRHDEYGPLCC